MRQVVLVREVGLFEAWLLLGALLAAPVFASTVVALPMLVDTSVPVSMAVLASWRAVAEQPAPMALWAVLIAVLVGLGMLTALLGLIVVIPVVAHASWHAYCDLVGRPDSSPQLVPSRLRSFRSRRMEVTLFGYTEGQIAQFGLTFGVGAFILYMMFIVLNLALESKAGKFGSFILFLVLSLGMLGFLAKNVIQWVLGI